MRLEEVLENLKNEFGDAILESEFAFEDLSILITNESYFELVKFLKTQSSFDQLADTTAVHYPDKDKPFQNVVHLFSNLHNLRVRIKVDLAKDESIDSLVSLYPAANWPERETWDFLGVVYRYHPNLTRIMNVDNFDGHPLRKEYPIKGKRDPLYHQMMELGKRGH